VAINEFLTLFTRASKLMRGAADDAMSRHGVRVGQNLLLEVLWEEDGLTPGELAERLHVATPTVVKSATRMEASGLVTRRRDPDDARLVRLYLTGRGRAVRKEIETERDELVRRATAAFTEQERKHVMRALSKIITALADVAPMDESGKRDPPTRPPK
jgi:MarR family transcriptional regulator, organic hydroperoxide resistance regulator